MTSQERNKRRALIVRRAAAYRIGRAQREIWRQRRAAKGYAPDVEDESGLDIDLLAELPDSLVG
jgi:hypothetical protein